MKEVFDFRDEIAGMSDNDFNLLECLAKEVLNVAKQDDRDQPGRPKPTYENLLVSHLCEYCICKKLNGSYRNRLGEAAPYDFSVNGYRFDLKLHRRRSISISRRELEYVKANGSVIHVVAVMQDPAAHESAEVFLESPILIVEHVFDAAEQAWRPSFYGPDSFYISKSEIINEYPSIPR